MSKFSNLDLASMYCLKELIEHSVDIEITGLFQSNVYGRLDVNVRRCNPITSNVTCASDDIIDFKMKGGYFALNFVNLATRVSNYSDPIEEYPSSFFTPLSPIYHKYIYMYMADNDLETDGSITGYLPPTVQKFSNLADVKTDLNKFADKGKTYPDVIATMVIRMDPVKTVTMRKYKKIYDYLADFGGISQVIAIFAVFMTFRMAKLYFFLDLAKRVTQQEEIYQRVLRECIANYEITKDAQLGEQGRIMVSFVGKHTAEKLSEKHSEIEHEDINVDLQNNENLDSDQKPAGRAKTQTEESSDRSPAEKRQSVRLSEMNPSYSVKRSELAKYRPPDAASKPTHSDHPQQVEKTRLHPSTARPGNTKISTPKFTSIGGSSRDIGGSGKLIFSSEGKGESKGDGKAGKRPGILGAVRPKIKTPIKRGQTLHDLIKTSLDVDYQGEVKRGTAIKKRLEDIGLCNMLIQGFFPCLAKKSRTHSILELIEQQFYSKYDFLNILFSLEELAKLKALLLNKEQHLLFEAVPSSKLNYVENEKKFMLTSELSSVSHNDKPTSEISSAYMKLLHSEHKSALDRNLISAFGFIYSRDKR